MHLSQYNSDLNINDALITNLILQGYSSQDKEFIERVYSEGSILVDPCSLIVDSACPKTVAGRPWMDSFIESQENIYVKVEKEYEKFKFGPSEVFISHANYEINISLGDLQDKIKVSVVDTDVPLLLGLDYQKRWGMIIDVGLNKIHIRKSNQSFDIDPFSSHWRLPIQSQDLATQAKSLVYHVELCDMSEQKLRKHIKKVHKNLSHRSEEQLLSLFKVAGKDTKEVKAAIKDVVSTCDICRRFKKTPPRPRVAMPKAFSVNEVVSMDLKERRDFQKEILYICDEFSGYVVAEVIKNKRPETIINAFNKRWVREGPGIPLKGIFVDNGGEFRNASMKELASK